MLASRIRATCIQLILAGQSCAAAQAPLKPAADFPDFAFSEDWKVLGPFQIGTREAVWGADPLELHGGFRALEYDAKATFKSSLALNGEVSWSNFTAQLSDPQKRYASAVLTVAFPSIDWPFLQDVYGWAAQQWQGWARGEIYVQSASVKTLTLNIEQILEFWIDDQHHFGGDFYSYGRAAVTLHLEPGVHRVDVRLVRDVRAMGGVGEPDINIKFKLEGSSGLHVPGSPDIISDIVGDENGPLASPYVSVAIRNGALTDAHIYNVEATRECFAELVGQTPVKLVPGQTRPIAYKLSCVSPALKPGPMRILIKYRMEGDETDRQAYVDAIPHIRGIYEPQKITYMHPGGMVSYAILRPPSPKAHCHDLSPDASLPVLLALHGAGLEADSNTVRHALDPVPDLCAWVLFPTGVTPWSGDDWHNWGFADVEAAIAAIPNWIEQVDWKGPGVDIDRWLVSGHSNGGQGVWYALTHRPDKVIAAAPMSGYSSIQNYVPYTFWRTADPGRSAVVQSSLNSYRHELLLENAKGIPIMQQHGSADDNVPAYHSRLLSQLLEQAGVETTYVEMQDKPHWWDGVMTTQPLKDFYQRHLNAGLQPKIPLNLRDFTVVSAGQGDMGAKNGVEILHLETSAQLGKVYVTFDPLTLGCVLHTSNVRVFRLLPLFRDCSFVAVDGKNMTACSFSEAEVTLQSVDGQWQHSTDWPALPKRRGKQQGAMDAILRTNGAFHIVHHSAAAKGLALQVSRNLCQYFAADTGITDDYEEARISNGSVISIAIGSDLPKTSYGYHPIRLFSDRIEIVDNHVAARPALRGYGSADGLAAIFLRALPGERLELVVWGVDEESLDIAARLVPLMTGTGQPDFVVADRSMLWKGLEGTLALGWFDGEWDVSRNSYFS
ncbi:hypothetical protein LTR85_003669 [Meristemomyces frigidus]|nr:hypothetical protein LTR85_003669 [Meristemomyces frigidus]